MRHRGVFPLLGLALLPAVTTTTLLAPRPAIAAEAAATSASITGIQGDAATLNAGANADLSVGQELVIRRAGREVGRLAITNVRNETATGRVTAVEGETVQVLDSVALPSAATDEVAVPPAPAPREPAPRVPPKTAGRSDSRPSYNESPHDIIPWERWEYMALSSVAAHGLIPGYSAREFQGVRQFTRGQLADLTAKALINFAAGAGEDRDKVFLDRLAHAFRYQPAVRGAVDALKDLNLPREASPSSTPSALPSVPGLAAFGGLRYASFRDDHKLTVTGRVGGIYDVSDKAFLALSINNLHDRTSAFPDRFQPVDVATINFNALGTDWEIGKSYWSSGPLMSGDGLLSDNSPGLYMVKGRRVFSWGRFPGKFVMTQIYGGFPDYDGTKYYGLRRIESKLSNRVSLGLAEAYVATKAPGPLSLVLPYYAYQRVGIFGQRIGGHGSGNPSDNDSFNYMAQLDLVYRVNSRLNVFGEYILDDVKAPFGLGKGDDTPRKIAYVIGAEFPNLFGGRGYGRFEIYNADRDVYRGIAPQVAWSQKDLLLGSPFGPNTRAFYGRLDYRFTDQWKGAVELYDALQARRTVPDMGDRYQLGVTAAYDYSPDRSLSIRLVPQRFRGQGYTIRSSALEVMGTYAY